jgi:hypothetical protein
MTEICFCVIKLFGNIPNKILKKDEVLRGMLELGYTYLSNLWLKLQTVFKKMQLIRTVLHAVKTLQATYSYCKVG